MIDVKLKKGRNSLTIKINGAPFLMVAGQIYPIDERYWPRLEKHADLIHTVFNQIKKDRITVYAPDGIGDLYWVFQKLGRIKAACEAKELALFVRDLSPARPHRVDEFVKWNPVVTEFKYIREVLTPNAEGFSMDRNGYDYVLDPTPVLQAGKRIDAWIPEIQTEYDFELNMPQGKELNCVVVYMGDESAEKNWATGWSDRDWVTVINELSKKTKVAVIGLECDVARAERIKNAGAEFIDLIGRTGFAECIKIIMGAKAFLGSISGLAILAAARKGRVVALWPGQQASHRLPRSMQVSWLNDTKTYIPLEYSSARPDKVVSSVFKIWRI